MSHVQRALLTAGLLVIVVAAAGCAKPPQAAIDAAKQNLSAAEAAGAPTYAPEAWQEAQKSVSGAMAEVEAQKARFALVRSYKEAEQMLTAASSSAQAADQAAVDGKRKVLGEAKEAMNAGKEGLAKADETLAALAKCPRRPKGFAHDLELMKGTVEGLRLQAGEVETAIEGDDAMIAKSLAQTFKGEVERVMGDLEKARMKLGC